MQRDTIVAAATPAVASAVGIVRLSGPAVPALVPKLCGRSLQPRLAELCAFRNAEGERLDQGLALYFPAPHSYTGEDTLELHGHGSPVVLGLLIDACLALQSPGFPIRLARAGEFTERAFHNGKLDLTQAEAVADLISANSQRAARAAYASLQGGFRRSVEAMQSSLTELRMRLEACLDFPEEEGVDHLADERVLVRLQQLQSELLGVLSASQRGLALNRGLQVVLLGAPNAGKSSLLNALADQDLSIVTDIPGTTRDRVSETLMVSGLPVRVTDTAGLRVTQDPVEQAGIARSWSALASADLVLLVRDATGQYPEPEGLLPELLERLASLVAEQSDAGTVQTRTLARILLVWNKGDLLSAAEAAYLLRLPLPDGVDQVHLVSAKDGLGLEGLRSALVQVAQGGEDTGGEVYLARARHMDALAKVRQRFDLAMALLEQGQIELVADQLRSAQQSLSELTGAFSSDDLLGEIFAGFCIGK